MNLKKCRKLYNTLIISGCGIILLGGLLGAVVPETAFIVFLALGTAVALSAIVVELKYYRCPHCGAQLLMKAGLPAYCPHCGKKLD